jgi:hypothetical protein
MGVVDKETCCVFGMFGKESVLNQTLKQSESHERCDIKVFFLSPSTLCELVAPVHAGEANMAKRRYIVISL